MGARYFPVALDVQGRRCLVVGGGHEAGKKTRSLLAAGAVVDVVSPRLLPELTALAAAGQVTWVRRSYRIGALAGYFLVFACTDNLRVNQHVAAAARRAGTLVNVVDRPAYCSFIMPAVARSGSLTFAVTTDGKSPAFAKVVRDRLAAEYGQADADFLDLLGALRPRVLGARLTLPQRGELFTRIVRSNALERLAAGDQAGMAATISAILKEYDVPWEAAWSTWLAPAPATPT